MNKLFNLVIIILTIFTLSSCFYTFKRDVSLDDVNKGMNAINYSDGINDLEAKYISQHYLLTTNEEPCMSLAKAYDIGTPYRKLVKNSDGSKHYYMGFLKYGWFVAKPNAPWLRLLVDSKTGNVSCIGEIYLKSEKNYAEHE